MQADPPQDWQGDAGELLSAGIQHAASADGGASHATGKGPSVPAEAHLSTLIAVASLLVPVSTLASVMGLEIAGVSMVMSADGAWVALALIALLCAPVASAGARVCAGFADADEPGRG